MPDGTPSLGLRGHRREQLVTSGYEAQRFDLRFFRPFRADLSIRKSSSFFPPLIDLRWRDAARVAFVRLWRAFPPALPTLARVRLQRLSPIGNCRNRPGAAENAANFFRSSASLRARGRRFQSSSASRFTAGALGFFIFNQSGERPER